MKLSKETIEILKNFSAINQNIVVKPGNVIRTISNAKNIFAEAKIKEKFEVPFGIYNLPEFLSALSLFNEPDLEFEENFVTLSEGKVSIRYTYADPQILVSPPDKEIKLGDADITFSLSSGQFTSLQKAAAVLSVQDLIISGNGSIINVTVGDKKNTTANKYSIDTDQDTGKKFKAFFKVDLLKFIPVDYEVSLTQRISKFANDANSITYYVATEADSEF